MEAALNFDTVPDLTLDSPDFGLFEMNTGNGDVVKPYYVYVSVNGSRVKMELDTGAAVSVISENLYKRRFKSVKLSPANCVLKTYSQESLQLMGKFVAKVKCHETTKKLELLVVKGRGPALMGRDWISQLKLDWSQVNRVAPETVEDVCAQYASVFNPELGKLKGIKAKLHVAPEAVPKFHKPRNVPYALKEAVERELTKLEAEGVISPINYSEWAAPIVCIPKKDDSVRLCGDYKVTINPWLNVDQYPLPKTQDLFAKLAGGQKFTKLDLSQAYQQVQLEESSRCYLTINTHKGLYQYNRLPYGVASAPAIFQKIMDQVLQGMDGVICYLDDILITGKDAETHLTNLKEVLKRLESYNLRVKREKCEFLQDSVSYLGHVIDSTGIHPMKEKTTAIQRAPVPSNVTELRSFLALLNYYGKFIPNLSTLIQPMTALLHKDAEWIWSESCQNAFENAKKALQSDKILVHFDAELPIILACDASPYGVGAVISHQMKDGSERPIAFASRTLTKTEQNYSQIEKEALGLVFGVMKFHDYLYGRKFILTTDHKPLLKILGPKTGVPTLAAARLQRWALILAAYKYEIQYKRSEQHSNADALSRLPMKPRVDVASNPIYRVSYLDELPITAREIAKETEKDSVLKVVKQLVLTGWPKHVQDEWLKPYFQRRFELTVEDDCLLWGLRVVVPKKLRDQLISELHEHHWGIVKMKSLARSLFWWPAVDECIEQEVSECTICQKQRSMP
uniref:Gypsy retrotransposon integrase-like protein 1 n=1 Tax=Cyprinodon variegatus TaxID=28743 RepID=A0A3Q2EGN4_CYPVA